MLEIITGPMFSGKSEELMRRVRRAAIAGQRIQVFTPAIDFRGGENCIYSHDGRRIDAVPVNNSSEIAKKLDKKAVVISIDEIQFMDEAIVEIILKLAESKRIIAACLNLDFRGEPFPFKDSERTVAEVMALSEKIDMLNAICTYKMERGSICGKSAHFTQRLLNNKPAHYKSPTIVVGSEDCYAARCREHHIVPGKPKKFM